MRQLADAGLTTREACGNSVRNITACPYAGVAGDEAFDVTPYAEALTRYLLRHPLSSKLPRKFKIAFEGCPDDHIALGHQRHRLAGPGRDTWTARRARIPVTVAGGTSTLPRAGHVLFEFLPVGEMLDVAEAIMRVFHRLGDYKHKQRNRLKFLVSSLGWDGFKAEFERELEAFRAEGGAPLPFDPEASSCRGSAAVARDREAPSPVSIAARAASTAVIGPGIVPRVEPRSVRRRRRVRAMVGQQRQAADPGRMVDRRRLDAAWGPDVGADASYRRVVRAIRRRHRPGDARPEPACSGGSGPTDVPELYRSLLGGGSRAGRAPGRSPTYELSGAESCRLAVTQSRGLGRLLAEYLDARQDLVRECARAEHQDQRLSRTDAGSITSRGSASRAACERLAAAPAPHYFVMVGGGTTESTTFGRHAATVPARRCDTAVERLVQLYRSSATGAESALGVLPACRPAMVKDALRGLDRLAPEDAAPEDFIDLAEEHGLRSEVQEGECSA